MKITIDKNAGTAATDFSWQFGMGNDHAAQMLRTDMCEHVKLAHDELGIKYIRFHGIFDDDMLVYQSLADNKYMQGLPGCKKAGAVNFHEVALVIDNVLKCGMKPFVELSFMPTRLASGKTIGFKNSRYNNNITMPKDMERWKRFIGEFVSFLLDRYGKEEVESWYFEVWNEPDLNGFFKGTQKDYFKLYKATAEAVKGVDENLRVGGPSTSACRWTSEFVAFCDNNKVPYDFVSTHHYPGDGFGNNFGLKDAFKMMKDSRAAAKNGTTLGQLYQQFFFKPDNYKDWKKNLLADFDRQLVEKVGNKPVFITEWNSMAVFGSPVHDEKYSAAFIIQTAMSLQNQINGYMFWCISDIFEEQLLLSEPFHGSFGIVNNNGIPKPNFWAFKMLSMLYSERLVLPKQGGDVEYAVFTNGKDLQVLIFAQSHDYYKKEKYAVDLNVNLVAEEVIAYRIDDRHCNAKAEWEKRGAKAYPTQNDIAQIKAESVLKAEKMSFESANGATEISIELHTNDVVLFELKGERE